jgi:hypothetical protein
MLRFPLQTCSEIDGIAHNSGAVRDQRTQAQWRRHTMDRFTPAARLVLAGFALCCLAALQAG